MPPISFLKGVTTAFFVSVAASIVYLSTSTVLGSWLAIRLAISIATLAYIVFLITKSDLSFGKIFLISLFLIGVGVCLYLSPSMVIYALFHVGFIWSVRAVYYHNNVFYSLGDLVFSVVGFLAAIGAIVQSQSVFMSFWSFFLAQALILPILHFVAKKVGATSQVGCANLSAATTPAAEAQQQFSRAHRSALDALDKLKESHCA